MDHPRRDEPLSDALNEPLVGRTVHLAHQVERDEWLMRERVPRPMSLRDPFAHESFTGAQDFEEPRLVIRYPLCEQVMLLEGRRGCEISGPPQREDRAVDVRDGDARSVEFFLHDDAVVLIARLLRADARLPLMAMLVGRRHPAARKMRDMSVGFLPERLRGNRRNHR